MQSSIKILNKTFRSWKFWASLVLAVMMTHVLFFPVFGSLIRDYSELNALNDRMFGEHNAITCHRAYSMDPEAFDRANTTCPDKYYRPNVSTTKYEGLTVYTDTYQNFLRTKRKVEEDTHRAIPLSLLDVLMGMYFNYVLVGVAYRICERRGGSY